MNEEAEKPKPSGMTQLGVPISDFLAAVDTLQQLSREGKYQIFLAREDAFKLVGDVDEFRVALGKKLEQDVVDRKRATLCLQDVKMLLQVCIATASPASAMRVLETRVYRDAFTKAKKDPVRTEKLRQVLRDKIDAVLGKLLADAFRERSKRLETIVGPVLDDVDVEVVSRRNSPSNDADIDSPFLRIRFLHTTGGKRELPFYLPPWLVDTPVDIQTFDLECDETDIDLLIRRLLQAKELLSRALEAKAKTPVMLEPRNA